MDGDDDGTAADPNPGYRGLAPVLKSDGGVIVEGFIPPAVIDRMNREFDPFVDRAQGRTTGSPLYDVFHGSETVVMHGLLAKAPSFEEC